MVVENFGSFLKHEREIRGVPIEEIADATKIHVRFLQALESNQFDELPGEVFIRGYIRSYARCIGANVDEMLAIYEESIGRQRKDTIEKFERQRSQIQSQKQIFIKSSMTVFLIALAGATWFLLTYLMNNHQASIKSAADAPAAPAAPPPAEKAAEAPAPPAANTGDAPAPAGAAAEAPASATVEPASPAAAEPPATKNETPDANKAAPAKTLEVRAQNDIIPPAPEPAKTTAAAAAKVEKPALTLTIRTSENAWFNITTDDGEVKDFLLAGGVEKTLKAKKRFKMEIGNRKGTKLLLNGKPLALPAGEDNVVRNFVVEAKGEEEATHGQD